MKKNIVKTISRYLFIVILATTLTVIIDFAWQGIPLFGLPDKEHIVQVEITDHKLGVTKTLTDTEDIELARGCAGWLEYRLGEVADEDPVITVVYTDDKGRTYEVSANETAVIYKGKAHLLKDDESFVKIVEGIFFLGKIMDAQNEYLTAYAEYLQQYHEENTSFATEMKFALLYVDEDEVPELAIIDSDAHASGVHICVYKEGEVTEVGEYGSFGKFQYVERGNLIRSSYMGQGELTYSYFCVIDAMSIELQSFHVMPNYSEDATRYWETYEVDGVEVSEAEYEEASGQWDTEHMILFGWDDASYIKDKGLDELISEMEGMLE
ncbi:MAG: hypothetical protein J1E64_03445 [Acetatifactor sp.]|nr:hypothetical protein [Acetatifactor sp.]